MKYRELKRTALTRKCRACINEQYGLALEPEDCYYMSYPTQCPRCGQVRNIVAEVRLWSRRKLWGRKEK